MKIITLTQGYNTEIDDIDYNYLIQWLWYVQVNPKSKLLYAMRDIHINKNLHIYMHHEILKRMKLIIPKGYVGDHKDRNSLNNQRENLRIVTKSEDLHNRSIYSNNTTGIKGVSPALYKPWVAQLTVNKIKVLHEYFDNYEDAVEARLQAEQQYLKETNESHFH